MTFWWKLKKKLLEFEFFKLTANGQERLEVLRAQPSNYEQLSKSFTNIWNKDASHILKQFMTTREIKLENVYSKLEKALSFSFFQGFSRSPLPSSSVLRHVFLGWPNYRPSWCSGASCHMQGNCPPFVTYPLPLPFSQQYVNESDL